MRSRSPSLARPGDNDHPRDIKYRGPRDHLESSRLETTPGSCCWPVSRSSKATAVNHVSPEETLHLDALRNIIIHRKFF